MPQVRYLGPATELDGKPVPEGGLPVNYTDRQIELMRANGNRFSVDGEVLVKPTPSAVNEALDPATGEADLMKATKATVADEKAAEKK